MYTKPTKVLAFFRQEDCSGNVCMAMITSQYFENIKSGLEEKSNNYWDIEITALSTMARWSKKCVSRPANNKYNYQTAHGIHKYTRTSPL